MKKSVKTECKGDIPHHLSYSSIPKTTLPRNLALRKHVWCRNKVSLLVSSFHVHLLCWDCASSQTGLLFSVSMCQTHKWFRLADYIRPWVSTIIKIVFCAVCLITKLLTAHSPTLKNPLERSDISLVYFIVREPWQEIKCLNQNRQISIKCLSGFAYLEVHLVTYVFGTLIVW